MSEKKAAQSILNEIDEVVSQANRAKVILERIAYGEKVSSSELLIVSGFIETMNMLANSDAGCFFYD